MSSLKGIRGKIARFIVGIIAFLAWVFVFICLPQILFGIGA